MNNNEMILNLNKKNRKRKIRKTIAISLLIIIIIELSFIIFINLFPSFQVKKFDDKISINYKEKYNYNKYKVCYGNIFSCKDASVNIVGKVDSNKLGKYIVKYVFTYEDKKHTINQIVKVVDKEKPVIKTDVKEIDVCKNGKINEFKIEVLDNFDGDITDKLKKTFKDNKVILEAKDSSNNKSRLEIKANVRDTVPPVITLNGNEKVYVITGSSYNDEGASATDNCDDKVDVTVSSNVNYNAKGEYYIRYTAKDEAGNESTKDRIIVVVDEEESNRVIYLTFDDGPSIYTGTLLDVLKKYNVKATFFVTGNGPDDMIVREYNEGHTVALHTNTHDYCYLYASVNNYFEDLNAVSERVKRLTGYESKIIRFPGGSSNTVSRSCDGGIHIMSILVNEVQKRGYSYFDWNVSSGDAGGTYTSDGVYYNVINNLSSGKNVVLQHDVKGFSVEAVERIIQYGLSNGYVFRPLQQTSYGAHHGINN